MRNLSPGGQIWFWTLEKRRGRVLPPCTEEGQEEQRQAGEGPSAEGAPVKLLSGSLGPKVHGRGKLPLVALVLRNRGQGSPGTQTGARAAPNCHPSPESIALMRDPVVRPLGNMLPGPWPPGTPHSTPRPPPHSACRQY